jgi:hypothetical protein
VATQSSPTTDAPYTLEQAEEDIAALTGQVTTLDEAHTQYDGGVVPNTPSPSGYTSFSASGHEKYQSADGNAYNTGTLRLAIIGSQTVTSTSPVIVGSNGGVSLSTPVAAAHYHFRFHVWFIGNGTGTGGTSDFRVACPAFTNGSYSGSFFGNGLTGFVRFDNTSGGGVDLLGPAPVTTATYLAVVEGDCIFTASGTLSLSGRLSAAGTLQYTIASNSFLELSPLT